MRRKINKTSKFKKAFKKLSQSGNKVALKNLDKVTTALENNQPIPEVLNPHALHGVQKGLMSVWLQGTQWVLVFKINPDSVDYQCLGSHKECYESINSKIEIL